MEALEERIVLSYLGSFRVPSNDGSGRASQSPTKYGYSYGGDVSTVDAEGDELWLSAHVHNLMIGKISIPDPVKPSDNLAFKELPVARATQAAFDVTQGLRDQSVQDSFRTMVVGDLVPNDDLVRWVMHDYYNVAQKPYRVLGSYNTQTGDAEGPYGLYDRNGESVRDQLSGRYLTTVPEEWSRYVGGTFASGGGGLPGQTILGSGPSLYAYSPPAAGADPQQTQVTATPLLEYPFDDHLPADQRRGLEGWNRASESFDAVWIGDTVVFAARIGIGEVWYGSSDGPGNLHDAYNPYKGYHAERYEMRLLFYRASDFAAVAKGPLNPWDPKPFANVSMPNLMGSKTDSQFNAVSMSWDEATGKLYVVQTRVDHSRSRYDRKPIVHVYDLSEPDALKRWAFQLSGQTHTLRRLDSPTLQRTQSGTTLLGAKADDGGLRQYRTLRTLSVEEKGDTATKDDGPELNQTTKAEREMSNFWSLENDQVLTVLNLG